MPVLRSSRPYPDEEIGLAGLLLYGHGTSQKSGVGILIESDVHRRLVEAASIQLELIPSFPQVDPLDFGTLNDLELIVADDDYASAIQNLMSTNRWHAEGVSPAVIAVFSRERVNRNDSLIEDFAFDGVLRLPQAPTPLAAKLGMLLYAHRSYARRYQSAVEELHLNRRIFQSLTSGVTVSDATRPDLPLTYVNPAFEAMTGFSLEEVRGRNCRFLQGNDRNQPGLEVIRKTLLGLSESTVVLRNYRKDGTHFWNEVTISPIRNRDNILTHFVGIQNDVTLRIEYEQKVRESEKLAAVGTLASSIAHEINNPLEALMNLVYLAQGTDCLPETKAYLAQIDRELQRMKLITTRSLRFHKQSTQARTMDCTQMLDSVMDLNESRLNNFGIIVERRDSPTTPLLCMEGEIRQVLNNLITNAIDALSARGGRLTVCSHEATEWRSGARGVMFTVADTGCGMNAGVLKKIYKAFFTTKGISGIGLGLWISREIVGRHHGELKVRSLNGTGTIFRLFLPHQLQSDRADGS